MKNRLNFGLNRFKDFSGMPFSMIWDFTLKRELSKGNSICCKRCQKVRLTNVILLVSFIQSYGTQRTLYSILCVSLPLSTDAVRLGTNLSITVVRVNASVQITLCTREHECWYFLFYFLIEGWTTMGGTHNKQINNMCSRTFLFIEQCIMLCSIESINYYFMFVYVCRDQTKFRFLFLHTALFTCCNIIFYVP